MAQNRRDWVDSWAGSVGGQLTGYVTGSGSPLTMNSGSAGGILLTGTGYLYQATATSTQWQFAGQASNAQNWEIKALLFQATIISNQDFYLGGGGGGQYQAIWAASSGVVRLFRAGVLVVTSGSAPLVAGASGWLRMTMSGSVVTVFTSVDGNNWTSVISYTDATPLTGTTFTLQSTAVAAGVNTGQQLGALYCGDLVTRATTYTLAGPSGGAAGVPSSNFTIALPAGTALNTSVSVTVSDGGGLGTFTPATVSLIPNVAAASRTQTYTPSTPGLLSTLSPTNNGGLTNPAPVTYQAAYITATGLGASGPSIVIPGQAASFQVYCTPQGASQPDGTSFVTPSDGGAGGVFTPGVLIIAPGLPTATFTYQAVRSGNILIRFISDNLPAPASLPVTAQSGQFLARSVNFGKSGTGLASLLGYTLKDSNEQITLPRTMGVFTEETLQGAGTGVYSFSAFIPANFVGFILVDDNATHIAKASVNPTYIQNAVQAWLSASVNDAGATVSSFVGDNSLAAADNVYTNAFLIFTGGTNLGLCQRVANYVGASRMLSFAQPFPVAPTNGDPFILIGRLS